MLGTEFHEVVAQLEIVFLRESLRASLKFLAICFRDGRSKFFSYRFLTFIMEQIICLNEIFCLIYLRPERKKFGSMGYGIS